MPYKTNPFSTNGFSSRVKNQKSTDINDCDLIPNGSREGWSEIGYSGEKAIGEALIPLSASCGR